MNKSVVLIVVAMLAMLVGAWLYFSGDAQKEAEGSAPMLTGSAHE